LSEARIIPGTDPKTVDEAVRVLRGGGLICYPTDTVYGIGAAAGDDEAVRRLFAAKGRSPEKALPLLLAEAPDARRVAEVTPTAESLAVRFWPGPLTIVMRKAAGYRSAALAGGETVALRVPDHDLVRDIVRALGEPVTGTSANRAGAPAPVTAAEVAEQVGDSVDLIIDGGRSAARVESTVIDITGVIPEILREGGVSRGEVEKAIGGAVVFRESRTGSESGAGAARAE
jgi:L-threonylcarbamoyladenylate synthase